MNFMYISIKIFLLFLSHIPINVFSDLEFDKDNYEQIFEYQEDLNWNIDISEPWSWFDLMKNSEEQMKCSLETGSYLNVEDTISVHGNLGKLNTICLLAQLGY